MKLPHRRQFLSLAAGAVALPAVSPIAMAQAWPSRPVRLVVGFPAGGGADAAARIVANRLAEVWGQQVVIENKGGAGGNIAIDAVAHAAPDGYTMLLGFPGLVINRFLYPWLTYDPVADFAPVSLIGVYGNLLVVPNSSPFKTFPHFLAYAKANPGKVTFATPGVGTSPQSGVPGFDVSGWYGLLAPAKTPPDILRKMHADAATVLSEPAIRSKFEPLGVDVRSSAPEEFAARMRTESELWGPIIKTANIKAE
jgi:tripartite-type tricarboxylate transporter receptor subunit TctC